MIPKFRAWLKNDKEMIDVDEIHWFHEGIDFIGDGITFSRGADEIELMQSTGLFDRNGKEIFEGDIVDYKGRKAVVKWHGSYASFIYRFVDELNERVSEWHPLFLAYYHFEIVGNIYENPELLEVEE
nr:MAG TPA: YopX protein [Caudoviricetes sp.]